jgi:type II secretory pathway pseudopilin PulG
LDEWWVGQPALLPSLNPVVNSLPTDVNAAAPLDDRFLIKKSGFTLVEVALSVAVVSFALIALVGLLSAGLTANQQSIQQSRALQAMTAAASGIWGMTTNGTSGTSYLLASPMSTNITLGSQPVSFSWGLDANGLFTNANNFAADPNLVGTVYMQCTPPSNVNGVGSAYITVAWPGYAKYVTSGSSGSWTRQQGYMETMIYFNVPTTN